MVRPTDLRAPEVFDRDIFRILLINICRLLSNLSPVILPTGIVDSFSHSEKNIDVIKKDRSDNMILGYAVEVYADFVKSGDKHLLELKEFEV